MACKKCKSNTFVAGRKRKRRRKTIGMKKGTIMSTIKLGLGVAAGIAAADIIASKVPFLNKNPALGAAASLFIAMQVPNSAGLAAGFKAGVAGRGMVKAGLALAPDLVGKLGISARSSNYMSDQNPGVAGKRQYMAA